MKQNLIKNNESLSPKIPNNLLLEIIKDNGLNWRIKRFFGYNLPYYGDKEKPYKEAMKKLNKFIKNIKKYKVIRKVYFDDLTECRKNCVIEIIYK